MEKQTRKKNDEKGKNKENKRRQSIRGMKRG